MEVNTEQETPGKSPANETIVNSDFVLVSEFSELEGPVALKIVPPGAEGRFNIDEFVLKIMAVDHQNKTTDISNS
jgi:hypothetical protein